MATAGVLVLVLALMLLSALPQWAHSRSWGYGPSAGLALLIGAVLVMMFTGRF